MKTLNELAIYGFENGSDKFGETIHKVSNHLYYSKAVKGYSKPMQLRQSDGTLCSTEIGFYVDGDQLRVISGREVIRVDVTPEIQDELDLSTVVEY